MKAAPSGSLETILVVDDNEHVRPLIVAILESKNYHVLSASSAPAAIKLAHETKGPIDLLLSELEFPEISGPDMGALLKLNRPQLRVMFMSAGAAGKLLVLNYGWAYIQKPFIGGRLTKMRQSPGMLCSLARLPGRPLFTDGTFRRVVCFDQIAKDHNGMLGTCYPSEEIYWVVEGKQTLCVARVTLAGAGRIEDSSDSGARGRIFSNCTNCRRRYRSHGEPSGTTTASKPPFSISRISYPRSTPPFRPIEVPGPNASPRLSVLDLSPPVMPEGYRLAEYLLSQENPVHCGHAESGR